MGTMKHSDSWDATNDDSEAMHVEQLARNVLPRDIPGAYYEFDRYVTKHRMLTFYHQIREILNLKPLHVLEVGIGPRVVSGTLREIGVPLTTMDVNPDLTPDIVGSVTDASSLLRGRMFDVVLCARVLHHLDFAMFEDTIAELARICERYVVLTLPVDELRLYWLCRVTAGQWRSVTVKVPLFVKRTLQRILPGRGDERYRELWKIDSRRETSLENVVAILQRHFDIVQNYAIPEDRSHRLLVLRKPNPPSGAGSR
jgi:hypothetical protein